RSPRCTIMANILVIDDDRDCREVLSKALKRFGHQPIEAANGWEGLIALDAHSVDLVLLDLMMPGMDGATFLRILRNDKRRGGMPVVVLSAVSSGDQRTRAMRSGVQDFVTKANYSLEGLMQTVERHLSARPLPPPPDDLADDSARPYHN